MKQPLKIIAIFLFLIVSKNLPSEPEVTNASQFILDTSDIFFFNPQSPCYKSRIESDILAFSCFLKKKYPLIEKNQINNIENTLENNRLVKFQEESAQESLTLLKFLLSYKDNTKIHDFSSSLYKLTTDIEEKKTLY